MLSEGTDDRSYWTQYGKRLSLLKHWKQKEFLRVINIHTIKPLDEEAILKSLAKTKCVVTAEEHNIFGGLERVFQECWH
jgi:transketolase